MATTPKLEQVELGFLEKCDDPKKLTSAYFPSKVGGKPAWLNPALLPSPERLACGECLKPCVLLLQVYAPLSDDPSFYHRSVYVFVCRTPACHKRGSRKPFRVFRCSLPKMNDYYKGEEEEEEEEEEEGESTNECESIHHLASSAGNSESTEAVSSSSTSTTKHTSALTSDHAHTPPTPPPTCLVCGCLGPMHCGRCKKVHYCSQHHQRWDWHAGHKLLCNDLAKGNREPEDLGYLHGGGLLLPVFEIVTETEPKMEEEEERSEEERCVCVGGRGEVVLEPQRTLQKLINQSIYSSIVMIPSK